MLYRECKCLDIPGVFLIIHKYTYYLGIHILMESLLKICSLKRKYVSFFFLFLIHIKIVQHFTIYLIGYPLICFKSFQEFFILKIKYNIISKKKQINTVVLLYTT